MTHAQRDAIVNETRTWIGTPYRGWSCLKGHGADCGQLIYGIFRACGFVPELDLPRDYSLQVAQHRVSTQYVDFISRFCRDITEAEVLPGDIVVYKLGLSFAHAGIVVAWPDFVVHAEARHGVSGTHGVKMPLFRRAERRFFTLKDEFCAEWV